MEKPSTSDDSTKTEDDGVTSLLLYALKIDPVSLQSDVSSHDRIEGENCVLPRNVVRNDKFVVGNLRINPALNWKPGKLTQLVQNYSSGVISSEDPTSFVTMYSHSRVKTAKTDEDLSHRSTLKREQNADSITSPGNMVAAPEQKRFKFYDKTKGQGGFLPPRKIEPSPYQNMSSGYPSNVASPAGLFTSVLPAKSANQNQPPLVSRNSNALGSNANPRMFPDTKNEYDQPNPQNSFKTAYEQLAIEDKAKGIKRNLSFTGSVHVPGLLRRAVKNTIEPAPSTNAPEKTEVSDNPEVNELMEHECMKNVDPKMVEAVLNEVVQVATTEWEDIAGLEGVKGIIREIIIWPMLRPDIFTGLRGPPKGILLFGPPGTGKTMIGKLIATQSKSAFFNISASSLTSKWIGDGEKMVRALFQVAKVKQPAVIFIDEIDSILTQRSDTEHESSRRLKTEFLIQFDGCGTNSDDRILVIGVTNRPQELDEAARRRLVKRIYIPLPDADGRQQLVRSLLQGQQYSLSDEDFIRIADITEGYSGADIRCVCQDASYGPIRDVGHMLRDITADNVRPIQLKDFESALRHAKASVAAADLTTYENWDEQFGCRVSQKS